MQDKLEKLFKKIDFDSDKYSYFQDASIDKVIVYDNNKMYEFIINTNELLDIDIYELLLDKLNACFKNSKVLGLLVFPMCCEGYTILSLAIENVTSSSGPNARTFKSFTS